MNNLELKNLLSEMSLSEKIGQMVQLMGGFYQEDVNSVLTGPAKELGIGEDTIRNAGSIINTYGAEELKELQDRYMAEQPHHIPLLFMMDVIHGMKTIFPIPLGQAASFDPELVEECASVIAKEASVSGLHVTFTPMVDLVQDARWGRVMEASGEDPYLNSRMAEVMVRGLQGDDMGQRYKMSACVKHFAGYGAVKSGREYNSVDIGENMLRTYHFPSYQAGIDAGAGMVMTAFHTIDGIPSTVNRRLMKEILRDEMGFDGVVISDFAAIQEAVTHGYCADEKEAAEKALQSYVDIDMMTGVYANNLQKLVEESKIRESEIDECVWRILKLKNKLGLFENPYKDADAQKEKEFHLCPEHRMLARKLAVESFVLLKNENILPLDLNKKIVFIGPYTNSKQIKSNWAFIGDSKDCVSIQEAAEEVFDLSRTSFWEGSQMLDNHVHLEGFEMYPGAPEEKSKEELEAMFLQAVQAAREADLVVMPMGEHYLQSGEAASRGMIDIPEVQMELYRAIRKVNDNIVVVLFSGRPLDLREISESAKAILEVWLPGTEGGHAIVDVLTGKVSPSGKLPMSFPYSVGQIPVYYNELSTGRPYQEGVEYRFQSKYIDIPNEPLYSFGYGLSYTTFDISEVEVDQTVIKPRQPIYAKVTVKNTGDFEGTETVQLYIRDLAASVARPVKELKGFQKVTLHPGESSVVCFEISEETLRFVRADGTKGSEPGKFYLWIGNSSRTENRILVQLEKV